jgi:hypothetical protein
MGKDHVFLYFPHQKGKRNHGLCCLMIDVTDKLLHHLSMGLSSEDDSTTQKNSLQQILVHK